MQAAARLLEIPVPGPRENRWGSKVVGAGPPGMEIPVGPLPPPAGTALRRVGLHSAPQCLRHSGPVMLLEV